MLRRGDISRNGLKLNISPCPLLPNSPQLLRLCQAKATQEDLEASEYRVYVMSSDNASLKRKLAEYGNIVRKARALADKERQRVISLTVGSIVILSAIRTLFHSLDEEKENDGEGRTFGL